MEEYTGTTFFTVAALSLCIFFFLLAAWAEQNHVAWLSHHQRLSSLVNGQQTFHETITPSNHFALRCSTEVLCIVELRSTGARMLHVWY